MQKHVILISMMMMMMMMNVLGCERSAGDEHVRADASLRFAPGGCLCQNRWKSKHLTCTLRTAPLLSNDKSSWRATWMLLPKAINHEITFSQLERLRARAVIAIAFNNGCLISPQQSHFCKNTQK